MIAIGMLIFGIGLFLGVSIIVVQAVTVLIGFNPSSKWTDPLPTIAGMGLVMGTGILIVLLGIFQSPY
jgi:hypothetical protein